jgi:hypothetical protein
VWVNDPFVFTFYIHTEGLVNTGSIVLLHVTNDLVEMSKLLMSYVRVVEMSKLRLH